MSKEQLAPERAAPDPGVWVDEHGDYLFRYAVFRLRDASLAEDVVQETLLAALQAYENFGGRGSERTWLVGILKHKVADHFRRLSREAPAKRDEGEAMGQGELFMQTGEWAGHWVAAVHPEQA
ncbi:MAG TPA: sigma factor, partial [Pyrinomonadaceae bacterium]|nr:sigma factor [Pyrinomonadaceae bacterium]